ncbi:MAG: hypothetical protein QOH49_4409 [Acidobacteriota bacterium]|jgi:hypothetical protein|nr:hypothetical protein [Acidobacteriota bacterium]
MHSFFSTFARALCALAFALVLCNGARAQQRPLITEDVDVLEPGSLRVQVGIDFMQDAKFPASGLTGDLTRVGVIGFHVGLSPNVEFSIEGVAQNFLSINTRGTSAFPLGIAAGATSTNDTGDFRLATKIKLRNETRRGPALGFKFGVELPNSNESRGIGLNNTNAFGIILMGKKFGREGRLNTFGNLGLGIYTAPARLFTQNDMLLYGLGGIFRVNKTVNLAAEVNGRANTRGGAAPLGTESLGEFRLGLQVKAAGLRFDAAGIKGLTEFSPRSGVTFGVTYDTPSVFTPVK